MEKLNAKQKRFCEEYIKDLNASQAFIRAGYSSKNANVNSAILMAKNSIKNYISHLQEKLRAKNEDLVQKVLDEFANIAFANAQDFVNGNNSILELKHMDKSKTAAVSKIKTVLKENGDIVSEIGFHSKPQALEALGRHLGLFEKDNKQKGEAIVVPEIKVYNSAPPLAGSESEVEEV